MKKMKMMDLLEATKGEYGVPGVDIGPNKEAAIREALKDPGVVNLLSVLSRLPERQLRLILDPKALRRMFGGHIDIKDLYSAHRNVQSKRRDNPAPLSKEREEEMSKRGGLQSWQGTTPEDERRRSRGLRTMQSRAKIDSSWSRDKRAR